MSETALLYCGTQGQALRLLDRFSLLIAGVVPGLATYAGLLRLATVSFRSPPLTAVRTRLFNAGHGRRDLALCLRPGADLCVHFLSSSIDPAPLDAPSASLAWQTVSMGCVRRGL